MTRPWQPAVVAPGSGTLATSGIGRADFLPLLVPRSATDFTEDEWTPKAACCNAITGVLLNLSINDGEADEGAAIAAAQTGQMH